MAPSFVARRKIGEKGVPRGCGPLNPRGNVLGHSDVLCANLLATVRLTRLSRAWRAPHCFHALCVLRCQGHGTAYDFTGQRSKHESVETVCLPHATDGPKSRKLHYGELVGPAHVSPPNPRIKARIQRAALEPFGVSFFHIFLHAKKDMATGGRSEKRMPVKTRKKRYRPRRAQD